MSSSGGKVVIEKIQMTCIHRERKKPKDKFLPNKKGMSYSRFEFQWTLIETTGLEFQKYSKCTRSKLHTVVCNS